MRESKKGRLPNQCHRKRLPSRQGNSKISPSRRQPGFFSLAGLDLLMLKDGQEEKKLETDAMREKAKIPSQILYRGFGDLLRSIWKRQLFFRR